LGVRILVKGLVGVGKCMVQVEHDVIVSSDSDWFLLDIKSDVILRGKSTLVLESDIPFLGMSLRGPSLGDGLPYRRQESNSGYCRLALTLEWFE